MPHIAVTMLPGRDRETKQKLAENLCNTLIETLGYDRNRFHEYGIQYDSRPTRSGRGATAL